MTMEDAMGKMRWGLWRQPATEIAKVDGNQNANMKKLLV
jgi:hypothetical protein